MTLQLSLLLLSVSAALHAKTFEQSLGWSALPPDLVGRKVEVQTAAGKSQSGKVLRVDAAGIALERRGKSRTVARGEVKSVEWKTRKPAKWSIVGTAAGAAPGALLTAFAVTLAKNEGGIYSNRNIGIAVSMLAAGAALGAWAGHSADVDRHVITIAGP